MRGYLRVLFILAILLCLLGDGNHLSFGYTTKKLGVYSETIPGCILYPDPDANSRLGVYHDNYGTTIDLYNDLTDPPEGDECLKAEINVVSGGWVGWFVQWGVEWEEFPNETTVVDMSIYATGDLNFWVKTPISLIIGIRSSNIRPGDEPAVNLSDYCPIDNEWHEVSIPISDFTSGKELRLDKTKILFNVAREGDTEGTEYFWVDNVRWTTDFYVENVTPNKGLNQGTIIDTINGQGFKDGAEVKLVKGSSIILGTSTTVISSERITTTLDLTGAQIGTWNVEVTNPGGSSAILSDGFEMRLLKPQSTGPVSASGRRILVNGASCTIKGVGYSPTPIGKSPETDWTLPDYGDPDIGVYDRDFNLLQKMNCNTIRTWGKVSRALLDKADDYGLKVICGFWVGYDLDLGDSAVRDSLIDEFRAYVANYKNKPAVLMWSMGNEQNYQNGDTLLWYTLVNEMAKAAYEEEGDCYHPVTTPNGELYHIGESNMEADDVSMNYLDVWSANVYRGLSFGDLFTQYITKSFKPFWVSEYGIDAWDHQNNRENQEIQAIYAATLWDEMVADSTICSGGTIMAYSDEWWKNGTPMEHNPGGYQMSSFPDGWSDEEYWGVMWVEDDGDNPDIMHPRVAYYTLQSKWGTSYPPGIRSITPGSGTNTGSIEVTIIGDYFQAKAAAELIGDNSITGTGTVVQTPDTIITTFNLSDASPGTCSVVVTNPDGQSDTLTDCFLVTFVHDRSTLVLPTKIAVGYPYPNPFNPQTIIPFELNSEQPVQLTIYSVKGALVRHLVDATLPAGPHSVQWDGRDEHGHQVASGVYFVRFRAGGMVKLRKLVLTK